MSITAYQTVRAGDVTRVTVTSDLAGTVYYFWYLDGSYVGSGQMPWWDFHADQAEQARVECLDSTDPDFDPYENAPAAYPPRRTLWWIRSTDADVDHYRIDKVKDGGDPELLAIVPHDDGVWSYAFVTGRLTDLSVYTWTITPVDAAGNEGTAVTIGPEVIVRTPDAPDFTATFAPATTRVAFAEDA